MRKNLVFFGRERSLKAPSSRFLGGFDVALSIGTLVGYLQLDDTNFNRKADTADRKLSALKLHLEALSKDNPRISVEVDAETAKIDEIKARIADLKTQAATGADVRVDITQAMIDLDRVQMKVRELHNATIKVDVDDAKAKAELDTFAAKADVATRTRTVDFEAHGLSTLLTGALTLGPALIPIAASATAIVGALGAPLAAAAGGGGLYALIAGKAVAGTEAQTMAIAALKTKMDEAQQSLNLATSKSSRTTDAKRLALDTAAYQAALAKLSPQQVAFTKAQTQMSGAFHQLVVSAGPSVFGPMTEGMSLLARVMPALSPVIKAVSSSLDGLLGDARRAVNDGSLDGLIHFFTANSGPAIDHFAKAIWNLGGGIGGLVKDLDPLSSGVMSGLDDMMKRFSDWAQSDPQAMQNFVGYVKRTGPEVGSTLHAIGRAIGAIVSAAEPLGGPALTGIRDFSDIVGLIAKSHAGPALLEIAAGYAAISKASRLIGKVPGAGGLLSTRSAGPFGTVASKAGAVPVFVTNPGFAGGSGGSGAPGTVTKDGETDLERNGSRLGRYAAGAAGTAGFLAAHPVTTAAVTYASIKSVQEALNTWDSGRRSAAAGKNSDSYKSILAALNDSNVGKYAGKLGINVPRLAQDVAQHGTKGAYYQQIQTSDRGVGAFVNSALGVLPGINTKGEDWTSVQGDLLKVAKARDTDKTSTDKQIASQKALDSLLVSPALPNYGKTLKSLPGAVQTLIATPGALTSLSQVQKLAKGYNLTPKQVRTVIELSGASEALTATERLRNQLHSLHNKTVNVTVAINGASHAFAIEQELSQHKAAGGIILGPGSGTSDSIPAMLSNGEFVVNAKAAASHMGLLQAINAQHFAGGGAVGSSSASTTTERNARERRDKKLDAERSRTQKKLDKINATLTKIQGFAAAFAPNAFSAGLATTKDVTTPGGVTTQLINGHVVTTQGAGTTKTVNLSNSQILGEMLTYAKTQKKQDATLARNIKKLRSEGVSAAVIAQMQAAGPEGIAEIKALASGTKAQVRQFNRLNASATHSLKEAGAYGYTGHRFEREKARRRNIEDMQKAIHKGLRGTSVRVTRSRLRVTS